MEVFLSVKNALQRTVYGRGKSTRVSSASRNKEVSRTVPHIEWETVAEWVPLLQLRHLRLALGLYGRQLR